MKRLFEYKNKSYQFARYPRTSNRSLQPWKAADEHVLQLLEAYDLEQKQIVIVNDRFGFLPVVLADYAPTVILNYYSQKKAIQQNADHNQLTTNSLHFKFPLDTIVPPIDLAIVKIPKSMDLLRLQLYQLQQNMEEDGVILCSFMTRHFTPQILEIASAFFEETTQSRAWKKSRVLILKNKKTVAPLSLTSTIAFEDITLQQYPGVFSGKRIDLATQFLIEHLEVKKGEQQILDLASGNGILAKICRMQNPEAEIHLLDDAWLAVESSKLNLSTTEGPTYFHFNDGLSPFEDGFFDLVVSNPPFHFGHENNIEVSIQLFREVKRCLKSTGVFQLVANQHLNYKTHLEKIFKQVRVISENEKFIIYEASGA